MVLIWGLTPIIRFATCASQYCALCMTKNNKIQFDCQLLHITAILIWNQKFGGGSHAEIEMQEMISPFEIHLLQRKESCHETKI